MKKLIIITLLLCLTPLAQAAELAGVTIDDQITAENGETLLLNGVGLREKFWVDIYVGSLYLARKTNKVGEILSAPGAMRIQMDFVYKEVTTEKLLEGWRDGFGKNQDRPTLDALKSQIEQFYSYFDQNALAKDRYILDYIPGKGTSFIKNNKQLGVIPGEDFRNALLEIWLGNFPADKGLKSGMLGL